MIMSKYRPLVVEVLQSGRFVLGVIIYVRMFLLSIVINLKGFETFVTLQLWDTNKVISVTHAGLIV